MCPFDSNGIFSLTPGYLAQTGQVIQPSQHNTPLEDISAGGLSQVLVRDGRAPMTGNLNMNSFKVLNVIAGSGPADAVNKAQLDLQSVKYVTKAANYTLVASDNDSVFRFTATATAGLTAAATLGGNWHATIDADGGDVTIDPSASETISGSTTLKVPNGSSVFIICSGSAFFAIWLQSKWRPRGIGELYYANTAIAGVDIPPSDTTDTVWVELTSGLTGVGAFNENKLTSESVSGSAPLVLASAVVNFAASPINGKTIRLLNLEERILRPSVSPGTLQNDQIQDHGHTMLGSDGTGGGVAMINNGAGAFAPNNRTTSANINTAGGAPRIGTETRMKNIGVKAYMRIA